MTDKEFAATFQGPGESTSLYSIKTNKNILPHNTVAATVSDKGLNRHNPEGRFPTGLHLHPKLLIVVIIS